MELFIYWKVRSQDTAQAAAAAARMQKALRARHPDLQAALYRRAHEHGDEATLMETYAQRGGVGADLQAAIEAVAAQHLQGWCAGPRHIEVFEALPA